MEEKNCCDRFSQIIFPSLSFFWQDASRDSFVEEFLPSEPEDWYARNIPARINARNKVPIIAFFCMVGWFLSI